ncbi:hypothetical protein D9Q98_001140 [Chlorella vulgaris]|uniref:N-acetyltransferase domain-containing protein n=1 Tax=Chlorella vulgaris TaxID=3077 RepID=A0A9D4U018_CHLVU|nr:hypothetical protein D9Q98_001140 [Chlorella vulgaris]
MASLQAASSCSASRRAAGRSCQLPRTLPSRASPGTPQWATAATRPSCRRRHSPPRLRAQRQQEEEQQQDFDELPDFQVPKFKPFTPQNALQRAMTSFRFWHEDSGGQTLLVTPLTNEHIKGTADLLTDSFAEAMSATVYKNYLRRQVKQYLDAHVLLPPKAVVLIALLLPPPNASYTDQQQQQQDGSQDSAASGIGIGSSSSSSSSSGEAADVQPSIASPPAGDQQPAVGCGTQPALDSMASSSGSSSSSTEDEALGALSVSGSQLVGVVELSFSASTRSKYLTLTPPEDRPYLCNMAIDPQQRNRGYGTALLQAAETLVSQLGESEIYLHLRVQDLPAAQLYKKAGYEEVAADSFLIRLLAIDQRRLMRKRLPKQESPQQQAQAQEQQESDWEF